MGKTFWLTTFTKTMRRLGFRAPPAASGEVAAAAWNAHREFDPALVALFLMSKSRLSRPGGG